MTCRICLEDVGVLISACRCKGFDHGYTHEECLPNLSTPVLSSYLLYRKMVGR